MISTKRLTALFCAFTVSTLPVFCQNESPASASPASLRNEIIFLAAGVPKILGERANYQEIFQQLRSAGITVFMPFSEYQEVPESKALTIEREFFPKYKTNDNAIIAMRRNGVKLLIPASILFAEDKGQTEAPLKQLISWAGRSNIQGIYSMDEPALQSADMTSACKQLYTRVKGVDKTLPVFMVHSSIPEAAATKKDIDNYLAKVKSSSQYADVVGFDVYAIPADLLKVKGPYSGDKILNYSQAISEYIRWLKENLPNKKHLIVLQAFSAEDQGHAALLARMYGDRRPSAAELDDMVRIVRTANVSVAWWGQSLVKDPDLKFWRQILSATQKYARPSTPPDRKTH